MRRALIYLVIAIGLLYLIRELEYMGVRKAENGEFAKLRTTFLEENNFDLIVIGSSRAECQFYTPIIDSATGLNCYNIGMTGATMPFIASTLEAYLVHSKAPKYVVLNLDLHSLGDNNDTVYRFPRYFAFLSNEKLYEGLQARDGRFVFFRWLPFYSMPYFNNRYVSNSVHGWLNTPTQFDDDYEKGFSPSIPDPTWGDLDTAIMVSPAIPSAVWDGVKKIKRLCTENNCELIFVISPLYRRQQAVVKSYDRSYNELLEYAAQNQIAWIHPDDKMLSYNKQYYNDPAHLTKEGAKIFTRSFSADLVQYLDK
jgi:hypothetical protein